MESIVLPEWLDLARISGLAVLTLAVVQYLKNSIPEKIIRYFTLVVGVGLAILSDYYIGSQINWFKAIMNGIIAAVLSDLGYSFLSTKGGSKPFSLPSKLTIK